IRLFQLVLLKSQKSVPFLSVLHSTRLYTLLQAHKSLLNSVFPIVKLLMPIKSPRLFIFLFIKSVLFDFYVIFNTPDSANMQSMIRSTLFISIKWATLGCISHIEFVLFIGSFLSIVLKDSYCL